MNTLALYIAGAGLALTLLVAGIARHQVVKSNLETARAHLSICQAANRSNLLTIDELEAAQRENRQRHEAELAAQERVIAQLQLRETERDQRNEVEIIKIRETVGADECADRPMPDDLRLRLAPAGH